MPRRSDIPWAKVQEAYESGETNVTALGKKFGVSTKQISRKIMSEKWETKVQLSDKVRSNVVDMFTKKAIDALGGEKALNDSAQDVAENLRRIKGLQKLAGDLLERTIQRALGKDADENGKPLEKLGVSLGQHQGETSAVLDLLNAVSKYTRDTRLDAGVPDGSPSAKPAEDDGRRRVHFVLPEAQEIA